MKVFDRFNTPLYNGFLYSALLTIGVFLGMFLQKDDAKSQTTGTNNQITVTWPAYGDVWMLSGGMDANRKGYPILMDERGYVIATCR